MTSYQDEFQELVSLLEESLTKKFAVYNGSDTEGYEYDTIWEMWESEGVWVDEGRNSWYRKAHDYWESEDNAPATVDGMLGGFESITDEDLKGSKLFLEELQKLSLFRNVNDKDRDSGILTCCECGAGIGRVSKGLLFPFGSGRCDLVEPSARILEASPTYIGEPNASKCKYICSSLQEFIPGEKVYDIVWIQWVIIYLTDLDFVKFMNRVGKSLKPGGIVVIKENVCDDQAFVVDKDDSSLTRSIPYLLSLLEQTNLKVIKRTNQDKFPEELFPVTMIAMEADDAVP